MRDPANEVELSFTIQTPTNMLRRCSIFHLLKIFMKSSGDIRQPMVNCLQNGHLVSTVKLGI